MAAGDSDLPVQDYYACTVIEVRGPLAEGEAVRFEVHATGDGYAAVGKYTVTGRSVEELAANRFRGFDIRYPEGSGL